MKARNTFGSSASIRWVGILGTTLAVATAAFATETPEPLAPVNLRSTAHFAILAGSLVSNIPASAVKGDIGLSPAAGSKITGFGLEEVTGTIFTVGPPGPANSVAAASELTAAKGDLTTAYNDAAGRVPAPVGPFLNPGAGNIGGMTLIPGLYKFSGGAAITGSDLTLTGGKTDVWIFQIATDLNVGNGIQIILAGGADAANIFWQVGTSATLGTTSVFKGTIMADQSISLNTGATLDGRALASIAAVTIASSTVNRPETATTNVKATGAKDASLLQVHATRTHSTMDIDFVVPSNGRATLQISDTHGQVVATLFNGEALAGKRNQVQFDARGLSAGLYFARLESNGMTRMDKIRLVN